MDGNKLFDDGSVMLSPDLVMVVLEAALELDALARILADPVPHHAVRGIAGRVLQLASVLTSAVSDDLSKAGGVERLQRVLSLENGQG